MSWLGRISQNRVQMHGQQPAQAGAAKADPAAFENTLASDKVIAKHGASLAPAAGDMQAIAGAVQGLKTHQARQFSNAVDQFYSALGRSTDGLEPAAREPIIKASMGAMRSLVEGLAQHPALMPAMAALSSLLEPRGKLDADAAAHADAAKKAVLDVVERFEAREGTSSVLFGFRNLVEGYESKSEGLTAKKRPDVWAQITEYLENTVPRPGCDQGQLGSITGHFMKALRKAPGNPKKALEAATAEVHAPLAESRAATLQQLDVVPPNVQNLPANAPQRVAHEAVREALKQIVDDNPSGPQALFDAVEQMQGKLPNVAQANSDVVANAYKALAKVLQVSGQTSAVITVLEHVAQNTPHIATHAKAAEIVTRAARMQKPESIAPLLVEAQLARLNRTPEQMRLVDALEKLKRLPAAPALRAAVALLPQIQQAHAAPLAEALFVEARTADNQDALTSFVTRFSQFYPQVRNQGEHAGVIASALAKDPKADVNTARQVANLVNYAKANLPNTPIGKLLEPGKNGEPGLIALSNTKDFIHNPLNMLNTMFQTIKQVRPNQDAASEARLAMQIVAEVARFDRKPETTDFPRINEDFKVALLNPKSLTPAKGSMNAPATSAAAFAAAHPEFPIEIVFSAARVLDEPRMSWLSNELSTSRSHAYKRVLRDALYAAISTKHLYFFNVLRQSPADRKAKEAAATGVAMEHRQGQAQRVEWDTLIDGLMGGEDPVARIEAEKAAEAMAAIGLDGLDQVDPAGMAALARGQKELQALMNFLSQSQYGKESDFFMQPLMSAVRAQAEGTWPAQKYESESAKEHLAPLRPEQLAAWKDNMATSSGAPPVQAVDPEQVEAVQLLTGVAKTLTEHIKIGGKGFEDIGWNQASLDKLRGRQAELLDGLRNSKKGSPEHRKLSGQIGPVAERVGLLELHAGLAEHFPGGEPPANPQAALAAMKPLALGAMGALRKQRATGFINALDTAAAAAKSAPAGGNARTGNYACDDDSLDAYLTAFGGGCIHPVNGFNRGSLVELINGSQYKMIRAMRDDKPIGRSFLRLVRVEMANGYKGMALRMDPPQASSGGAPGNGERALMYKHALKKAVAMGVPLMVSDALVQPAAQEMGLKLEPNQRAKTFVHKGVTGMHHNQGMWNADYYIAWQGVTVQNGGPKPAPNDKECGRDYTFQVVMPPDWKA